MENFNNLINCVTVIICITILVIAIHILTNFNVMDWKSLTANVNNIEKINNTSDKYKISISYIVNNIEYSKNIIVNKSFVDNPFFNNVPINTTITIYYNVNKPNKITLINIDYQLLAKILIVLSIIILLHTILFMQCS